MTENIYDYAIILTLAMGAFTGSLSTTLPNQSSSCKDIIKRQTPWMMAFGFASILRFVTR